MDLSDVYFHYNITIPGFLQVNEILALGLVWFVWCV